VHSEVPISAVLIGAGKWCDEYWVPFLHGQDHVVVHAVVDLDQASRTAVAKKFDSAPHFGSLTEAVAAVPGLELALIVSGPESHPELIIKAHAHCLDVVSEKPAALDPEGLDALRALPEDFRAVITQNYRYEANIQTVRAYLASGDLGAVRSIHARFAADYRMPGSWDVGDAHHMAHPMLLEGSIHHFDMMRYLLGSQRSVEARRVVTLPRNPAGSSFQGDSMIACLVDFDNGVIGTYEASLLCAGHENRWHHEYYRLECEVGSIECDGWRVQVRRGKEITPIETIGDPSARLGHLEILEQYLRWRRTGQRAETALSDNLKSLAIVMAAVRSAETGHWADVR
jgi:predicted dehydrogenase